MTTTTEASIESRMGTTLVVRDDALINVSHFTTHPNLGSYQLSVDVDRSTLTVYLTPQQAQALYHRLGDALVAAEAVSA